MFTWSMSLSKTYLPDPDGPSSRVCILSVNNEGLNVLEQSSKWVLRNINWYYVATTQKYQMGRGLSSGMSYSLTTIRNYVSLRKWSNISFIIYLHCINGNILIKFLCIYIRRSITQPFQLKMWSSFYRWMYLAQIIIGINNYSFISSQGLLTYNYILLIVQE